MTSVPMFRLLSALRRTLDAEVPYQPERSRLRRALARRAAAWKGSPPTRGGLTRSAYGVWLVTREEDQTFRFCADGSYGFAFANLLRGWRRPFVFLDFGANIGLYSLIAARSGRASRVVAFEPDPGSAEFLRRNSEANGVQVEVVEAAVSSTAGSAVLFVPKGHSGRSSLTPLEPETASVTVPVLAAGDLAEALWRGSIDDDVVVKIDVEGHELEVLKAILEWNGFRDICAVWIEFSAMTDSEACTRLLEASGFRRRASMGWPHHSDVLFMKERA